MNVSLTVAVPGTMEGQSIPITPAEFLIGRDPECDLCPGSTRVGRRHCAIVRREDRVFLKNFDMVSATYVNDRRVDGEVQLLDGDWLKIGPLLFRVNIEAPPHEEHHENLAAELLLLEAETANPAEMEGSNDKVAAPEPPKAADQPTPWTVSPEARAILDKYRYRHK